MNREVRVLDKNLTLLKLFLLASSFTFSEGLAMIPMLYDTLVVQKNYMTDEEFYHYISIAQTVPGVTVITTACLLGNKVNGKVGKFFACLGAVTPVLIIMTVLTVLFQMLPQEGVIFYALSAVRATAGVFILEAVFDMAPHLIKKNKIHLIFTVIIVIGITFFKLSIVLILLFCLMGAIIYRVKEKITSD